MTIRPLSPRKRRRHVADHLVAPNLGGDLGQLLRRRRGVVQIQTAPVEVEDDPVVHRNPLVVEARVLADLARLHLAPAREVVREVHVPVAEVDRVRGIPVEVGSSLAKPLLRLIGGRESQVRLVDVDQLAYRAEKKERLAADSLIGGWSGVAFERPGGIEDAGVLVADGVAPEASAAEFLS